MAIEADQQKIPKIKPQAEQSKDLKVDDAVIRKPTWEVPFRYLGWIYTSCLLMSFCIIPIFSNNGNAIVVYTLVLNSHVLMPAAALHIYAAYQNGCSLFLLTCGCLALNLAPFTCLMYLTRIKSLYVALLPQACLALFLMNGLSGRAFIFNLLMLFLVLMVHVTHSVVKIRYTTFLPLLTAVLFDVMACVNLHQLKDLRIVTQTSKGHVRN